MKQVTVLGLAVGATLGACAYVPLGVSHTGSPVGRVLNVSNVQTYISYPPGGAVGSKAILIATDIYGLPGLQNRLVADSIARANYTVVLPDLFRGDAVPFNSAGGPAYNLTEWRARHPQAAIDAIINSTLKYIRNELNVTRVGGAGYCFGGKQVPRWLAAGKGIDVGFIAHPTDLLESEIEAIAGPISIAAGELDATFNATARRIAEDILERKNLTFETSLYADAPHAFALRVDVNNRRQKYAKEASYFQAVQWFDYWL